MINAQVATMLVSFEFHAKGAMWQATGKAVPVTRQIAAVKKKKLFRCSPLLWFAVIKVMFTPFRQSQTMKTEEHVIPLVYNGAEYCIRAAARAGW